MADPFRYLIEQSGLYPKNFVRAFGEEGPHWYVESWYSRELSLRHDMVCTLLANMEPSSQNPIVPIPGTSSQAEAAPMDTSSATGSSSSSEGRLPPPKRPKMDDAPDDDADEEMPIAPQERDFRIILLEGSPAISAKQNQLSDEWGLSPYPNSYWDLADLDNKKFIEVKVTLDPSRAKTKFIDKSEGMEQFSSLALVSPVTGETTWHYHTGGLRGEAKVITFLAKRRMILASQGALETAMMDKKDLEKEIFVSSWFNTNMSSWSDSIWALRNIFEPVNYNLNGAPSLKSVTVKRLLSKLEDPRERPGLEVVKWRGKILPETMIRNITVMEADDTGMVNSILREIGEIDPNTDDLLCKAAIEAFTHWNNKAAEDQSSFSLISEGEYGDKDLQNLESSLGIGVKTTLFNAGDTTTRQPDYPPIPPERYHHWFTDVVEDLNRPHELPVIPFRKLNSAEFRSTHPMSAAAQSSVDSIVKHYTLTKASLFASKITNTYSRLGRSYAPPKYGKNSGRANTVIFPLYATTTTETGEVFRVCHGLLIRGPNHARVPTDRINFITIEMLHHRKGECYVPFIQNCHYVKTSNGTQLCIRSNSISRGDPNFLIFINNALFVTCNLVGEIVLTDPRLLPNSSLQDSVDQFCRIHSEWINSRVVEGLLMATTGGSQEEGFFAQLRKIFMVLLCLKRGQDAFSWDLEALCNKTNECLINRPFGMYFACAIIDIMKCWDDRTKRFAKKTL